MESQTPMVLTSSTFRKAATGTSQVASRGPTMPACVDLVRHTDLAKGHGRAGNDE